MSRLQADALIPEVERMKTVLRDAGIRAENPVMRLATAALPVLPSVKITDMGLVDTGTQEFMEFFL
jgi:adenine deaminase